MNILGPLEKKDDLNDKETEIAAAVINQYIREDGIVDKGDFRVERFMRFSIEFLSCFQTVTDYFNSFDDNDEARLAIVQWQTDQDKVFIEHAEKYQFLYQQVSYMAEPPYHMTAWSMCALVESSLKACGLEDAEDFSEEDKEKLKDVLGFSQNLLQTMFMEKNG